jgi:hypothetical protein
MNDLIEVIRTNNGNIRAKNVTLKNTAPSTFPAAAAQAETDLKAEAASKVDAERAAAAAAPVSVLNLTFS